MAKTNQAELPDFAIEAGAQLAGLVTQEIIDDLLFLYKDLDGFGNGPAVMAGHDQLPEERTAQIAEAMAGKLEQHFGFTFR